MSSKLLLAIGIVGVISLSGCSLFKRGYQQQTQEVTGPGQVANQNTQSSETMVSPQYQNYSEQTYTDNQDKRRVLFFHAAWCPTCKAANLDLEANASELPEDVVVLKTDYDTERELKETYGITYQHTFVQVDSEGNEVAKWNGGGVDQINSKVI